MHQSIINQLLIDANKHYDFLNNASMNMVAAMLLFSELRTSRECCITDYTISSTNSHIIPNIGRVVWGNSVQHGAIRDRVVKTSLYYIHLLIQVLKHPMC